MSEYTRQLLGTLGKKWLRGPSHSERADEATLASMVDRSAHDVAAEIRRRLPGVATKKLHKLLYYCQGHHVAVFGRPLFHESISAWDMGPVVGTLWYQEKQGESTSERVAGEMDEAELNTVGFVISRYGTLSGVDLEHLTHSEPPWQVANTRRKAKRIQSERITLRALQQWFRSADPDDPVPSAPVTADVLAWLAGAESRRGREPTDDEIEAIRARL